MHTYTDLSHSVHLKCSEPFLETRGWLDGGDSPSLCPLTVGCSDVAKRGGCGRAWDYPRWAAGSKGGSESVDLLKSSHAVLHIGKSIEVQMDGNNFGLEMSL